MVLEQARKEAERIVREAKDDAARIRKEYSAMIHKQARLEDYLRESHLMDSWYFREGRQLNELLKENRQKQREQFLKCPYNAIKCDGQFTDAKLALGIAGLNLIESRFDKVARKAMQTGLVHGRQNLLELMKETESQISYPGCRIGFSKGYKALKVEELKLLYKMDQAKREEKEKLQKEKELAREESKAQKEFERELKKAQKDEDEARKALEKAELEAAKEKENAQRLTKLQEQIEKLKTALKEAEERGQRIMSMAQQTRRGWVYVISNIGSFGEGVFKIGLTRRLDPMERVYELGDASVPFPFDVHAFIFSEDAPALETALHQAFENRKVNSVNCRKEYFKVPLGEIKDKVKELGYDVEWEDYAYAPQYRDSMQ